MGSSPSVPAGFAQSASPAGDNAPSAAATTAAKDAAPPAPQPAAQPETAPAAPTAAPAAPPAVEPAATPAPKEAEAKEAAQPAAASAPLPVETPAPAATQVVADDAAQPAAAPADAQAAAAKANATPQPGAVIPLIVMDDVPLTDAIRNLARQAGLNYMLDPKIGYGQIGPDGKQMAQPSVSIRWENITAEQALNALLNNYTLQLVQDPKANIARITTKDPAAPPPLITKIIQLRYAGPSNVVVSVQSILLDKRSKVVPDNRTSQLVVIATEPEMAQVDQLIQRLDTQTKQVLIEARLIETSMNPTTSKGVDWTGTLQNQGVSFGNNLQQNSPDASVNNTLSQTFPKMLLDTAKGFNPATAFLDADGVNATISFLNTYLDTKVISAPRTVTLDNEPAKIEVTRETPVINVTAGTANTTGGSSITYSNLGVILNVTPRISANDFINLKVVPELSRNAGTVSKTIGGEIFQADEYDVRRVETRVMIPSGNTLVMGGMIQDSENTSNIKVPVLGDIPLLGGLFRSDSKSRLKQNLIIFITPTIVQDEDYQPTKSTFLKQPVPVNDSVGPDWSAWDSGKPKDWSGKAAKPTFTDPPPATN